MDWFHALVGPDEGASTIGQFCARAVVLLAYGILSIRIAGRRTFSSLSPLDIFIAIVVGSNISRVMTGNVAILPSLAATLLLVSLHRLLAMATVHSNLLAHFIKGSPQVLVRDGVADSRALRRFGLSEEDLAEALRMGRLERADQARLVIFERGGKISVVPKQD